MQEKDLKPSRKQRLIFALVAVVFVGLSLTTYILIVMGKGNVNYSKMSLDQLQEAYSEKSAELDAETAVLSSQYFEEFKSYKKNVKAYNSSKANSNGVQANDLKEGDGETVGSSNYAAYYIGWCSDESIFDSSFDDFTEPTSLKSPLDVQPDSLIEGWYLGVEGMKIGGVREITIPGSLAYGDSMEICGGKNSPIKFIVMAIEKTENYAKISKDLDKIYEALSNAYSQAYADGDYSNETEAVEAEEE